MLFFQYLTFFSYFATSRPFRAYQVMELTIFLFMKLQFHEIFQFLRFSQMKINKKNFKQYFSFSTRTIINIRLNIFWKHLLWKKTPQKIIDLYFKAWNCRTINFPDPKYRERGRGKKFDIFPVPNTHLGSPKLANL